MLEFKIETLVDDDQSWLASSHGTDAAQSITLDVSTFSEAEHYPDGYLPSGLPLARLAGSSYPAVRYGPASDALSGLLLHALPVPPGGIGDVAGALHWHGAVHLSRLPVAVSPAAQTSCAGMTWVE